MLENHKHVEDTYATRHIVEAAVDQVQMKQVMAKKTPGRYLLKAMMS